MTLKQKQQKNKNSDISKIPIRKTKTKKADKTLKALLNKKKKKALKSKPFLSETAEQMQRNEKLKQIEAAQESLAETKSDPDYDPNAPNKNKKKRKSKKKKSKNIGASMVIYCDAGVRKNKGDLIEKLVENKVKFAKTLTKRVTHYVIDDGWRDIEEHKKAKKRKQDGILEIVRSKWLIGQCIQFEAAQAPLL